MNTSRTHSIAWRDFANAGVVMTEDALDERIRQFKLELSADLPALRSLFSSTLSFSFTMQSDHFRVIANLVEVTQIALRLSPRRDGKDDLFAHDISRVHEDQKRLRDSYAWAFYTDVNPTLDDRIIELRRRLRQDSRSGRLHIHTGDGGEPFETGTLPKVLASCQSSGAMVKVEALSSAWVDAQLVDEIRGDDMAHPYYFPHEKIRIWRDRFTGNPDVTNVFASAMDSESIVAVQLAVELSWVDGSPSRLTLLDSPTATITPPATQPPEGLPRSTLAQRLEPPAI